MRKSRHDIRYWPLWASLAIILCPSNAEAHLVTTGLGPIYDGIGHLALSPEVWVPVLALALFAGLRGAAAGRLTLFLLPVAWLAGALVGYPTETAPVTGISAISFLVSGALVAADLRLKRAMVATIAVVLGFCDGCLNGMTIQPTPSSSLDLVGAVAALFVAVAIVAAFVIWLKRPWMRVAVRVVGSWITATGLLLLGWSVHSGRL
ncbi:MAG: HupE/UreJ family protein [Chthoniobacterales bacterium]